MTVARRPGIQNRHPLPTGPAIIRRQRHIALLLTPLVALLLLAQSLVASALVAATCDADAACAAVAAGVECDDDGRCAAASDACDEVACTEQGDDPSSTSHDECGDTGCSDTGCADSGCARLCGCCSVVVPLASRQLMPAFFGDARLSFPPAPVRSPQMLASSVDHPPCWTI